MTKISSDAEWKPISQQKISKKWAGDISGAAVQIITGLQLAGCWLLPNNLNGLAAASAYKLFL
jgi:hypothetical protein